MAENSLTIKPKPPIPGLRKGIALQRQQAEQQLKTINPNEVPNRLGLVVDDSGSMGHEGMENVHKGVRGFTASCNPLDTSIAVYPLNEQPKHLVVEYDLITMFVDTLQATGGTPLYTTLQSLIETEKITRAVVFSDGEPTDSTDYKPWGQDRDMEVDRQTKKDKVLGLYIAAKLPIDTIFIGNPASNGYKEMKDIAEKTGGTFVNFQDSHSLGTSLKYLAPRFRALLANPEIKARIEKGEQI